MGILFNLEVILSKFTILCYDAVSLIFKIRKDLAVFLILHNAGKQFRLNLICTHLVSVVILPRAEIKCKRILQN